VRTVEPSIQRDAMMISFIGYACKGLRAGQAPLFGWCIREGVEQHVNYVANEGMPVELLHHVSPHLKNELQMLHTEETRWILVAICNWVEQWGLSQAVLHGEFLLEN
jgi:hypothetical protein